MEKNILIVDDIWVNRMLLSEIVSQLGFSYSEAENGKVAVDKMMTSKYDAVLMDVEMPVMNGIEATKEIKNHKLDTVRAAVVIGITAHDPAEFFADFADVGFDGFVTKPYTADKLSKVLCDLLKINPS